MPNRSEDAMRTCKSFLHFKREIKFALVTSSLRKERSGQVKNNDDNLKSLLTEFIVDTTENVSLQTRQHSIFKVFFFLAGEVSLKWNPHNQNNDDDLTPQNSAVLWTRTEAKIAEQTQWKDLGGFQKQH